MTISQARSSLRQPIAVVAIAAVILLGLHLQGLSALGWEAPWLGALIAMRIAEQRRRSTAALLGGAAAGACIFFINRLDLRYTGITIFAMSDPAWEATGGALWGAIVGLITAWAIPLTLALTRIRFTRWKLRDAMIALAILAVMFHIAILLARSDGLVRFLMISVAMCVVGSWLLLVGLRRGQGTEA
jgi:hypothetical protein